MDARTFIAALRTVARDPAIAETIGYVADPPGRQIPEDVKALASWYQELDPEARHLLSRFLEKAVDAAIFGVLCVLDGARAIEEGPAKGRLQLTHIGQVETVLNSPNGPLLHELY